MLVYFNTNLETIIETSSSSTLISFKHTIPSSLHLISDLIHVFIQYSIIYLFYNSDNWYTSGVVNEFYNMKWEGDGSNIEPLQQWWYSDTDRLLDYRRIVYKTEGSCMVV